MNIHAIQTGTVAITTRWREGAATAGAVCSTRSSIGEWTEPLPIYAFAIEHPEGVIVVDTGETARVSRAGLLPALASASAASRSASRSQPEQEIGPQLERLGIRPRDVRRVVMTHLHTDHAGGLHHFPDSEILVSRAELEYAGGLLGRVRGYPNKRWPAWFDPTPIDLAGSRSGPFPASLRLTEAGDVTLVPVPGHTPGQVAVVVEEGDHTVFLAGDSSYTEDSMLRGLVDGVGPDEAGAATHARAHPRLRGADADRLPPRPRPRDGRASHRAARGYPYLAVGLERTSTAAGEGVSVGTVPVCRPALLLHSNT